MRSYINRSKLNKLISSFLVISIFISIMFFYPMRVFALTNKDAAEILANSGIDSFLGMNEETYEKFVNELKEQDSTSSIEEKDGKIIIKTSSSDKVRTALVNTICSNNTADADLIANNTSDIFANSIEVVVVNGETGKKDSEIEKEETSSSNANNENNANTSTNSQKTGAEIFNELKKQGANSLFDFDDSKYNSFVSQIKEKDNRGRYSVEIVNGNKIVVKAVKSDVELVLKNFCSDSSDAYNIAYGLYPQLLEVDENIQTTVPEGENDTRTEEEKIEDKIVEEYNYSPSTAKLIVENKKYVVNEDGSVTVTATADELKDYGASDAQIAKNESSNTTIGEMADQLGGILLRPIFALVNYIADSVMRVTGEIMYPEAYNSETGDRADIMTAGNAVDLGYKKSTKVEVDVSNFKALSKKYYPQFRYTPEEIFSGQVNILSIDFISGKDSDGNTINNTGWTELRKVIAGWYKALRLIAAIGLLSVLIYTGIKIIMSSTARDKAKYKEWIVNWFIAAALLFTMHYIMSFIITVNSEISNLLYTSSTGIEVVPTNDSQGLGIKTFTTNLMGLVRFHILEESFSAKIAYEIMYVALIVYTLKFTFVYLKRVLNMAFLTLIAPIVALTYPIDKMNDGRAQGFEMWLKEYTFNALLQILHFLLYNILISSAIELAANNIIYAIVALGFMNEAERLLKKIFGFDKANGGTVGGMSAITAATVASSFKNLGRLGKGKGGNRQDSASDGKIGDFKPKTVDGTKGLMAESNSPNSGAASGGDSESSNEHPGTENGSSDRDQGNDNPDSETGDNSANLTGQGNDTDTDTEGTANDAGTNGNNGTDAGSNSQGENTEPVQDLARGNETGRLEKIWNGAKSLGKSAIRPIYDVDKTGSYNRKRFVRNVARGALGTGMGVTAAAVQAGISITDGKYNPMEAVGAFSAGYAGAGAVANKGAAIGNTFMSGYNSGDNNAKMKQAVEDFKNRDDVIAAFKKKYGDDWKDKRERAANNYYAYGETDVSKMIKNMDNADKLMKSNESWDTNTADTQMRNIEKARKELKDMNMYGKVMNDNEQAEKFIQSQVSDSVSEAQLRTLLAQMKQTK